MPPSVEAYPRHRRSRTGCLTCRKAKHKCDEGKPICGRCVRTARPCTYPSATTSTSTSLSISNGNSMSNIDPSTWTAISTSNQTTGTLEVISPAESSRMAQFNGMSRAAQAIPPAITLTDLLALSIPDAHERSLLQHFLCFGTVNLHAIPHPNKPIHCFDVTECFQNRRGTSMEVDSFFLSLISIAAVHRSSMFLQMERKYLKQPPIGRWGVPPLPSLPPNERQIEELRKTGIQSSKASIQLSKISMSLKLSSPSTSSASSSLSPPQGHGNGNGVDSTDTNSNGITKSVADILLTSIVCVCISQVMLVSKEWKEAYQVGLQIIKLRGGPQRMLKEAKEISTESMLRTRALLENLAIIDVWHCLASGNSPTLLEKEFQPWWFDFADQITDSTHPDSFQFICGMDRGMLEMVNRVNILVHEYQVLSKLPNQAYSAIHSQKVQDMLLELDIWEVTIGSADRLPRVQLGNLIIAYTMRVVISVELLKYPHSHPTVQSYALAALNHLETSRTIYTVNMLVPTIIVGSMMIESANRDLARKVIKALRSDVSFSYDVEETVSIIEQLYTQRDQGIPDPSWRPLLQDILLL
ncbi:uncharacterized protein IL334_005984 [Kwoniella shivajii]|uniref:Zn(2)-C6 fungal-type domain-containing protein n=1 Tax=Kwoniella shivajii TaxID=564305 RepID=A0ABZ1D5X5_9TREE|nr:hypothetical protein IL334_005984 [Kwoniella shivajii]